MSDVKCAYLLLFSVFLSSMFFSEVDRLLGGACELKPADGFCLFVQNHNVWFLCCNTELWWHWAHTWSRVSRQITEYSTIKVRPWELKRKIVTGGVLRNYMYELCAAVIAGSPSNTMYKLFWKSWSWFVFKKTWSNLLPWKTLLSSSQPPERKDSYCFV